MGGSGRLAVSDPPARPTAIDLYAGAGGLSLGLEQAGFDVLAAAEIDPIHSATHLYNFPNCEIVCRDLSAVSAEQILRAAAAGWKRTRPDQDWPGQIDVVVGGPPCQGFSVGGVRDPNDSRNEQIQRFAELVITLKPRVFLLENVAGLLERRFDGFREDILVALSNAGYSLSGNDAPVDAADFGVPQHRRRVLIFGSQCASPIALKAPNISVTVGNALAGLPFVGGYRRLLHRDWVELHRVDIDARNGCESAYARRLSGLERDEEDRGHLRAWAPEILTNSLRTVHSARTRQRFSRTTPGSVEPVSRLFRLHEDQPARTLRAGTGAERGAHTSPRPIHPNFDRVITVREAARLHGYPDWFRFHVTNWHGHRQIGNSVPPPLARAAGLAMIEALGVSSESFSESVAPVALGSAEFLYMNPSTASDLFAVVPGNRLLTRTKSSRALAGS